MIIDKRFLRQELFGIRIISTEMDPIFIYYNNLKFAKNKQFVLEFDDENLLQKVI